MRFTIKSLFILFCVLSVAAIIPPRAGVGTDMNHTVRRDASQVLEPPILEGIEVVDDDLILQMRWESNWTSGASDVPGTLFIDHRAQPAGRAIALSIDASALAMDSGCRIRVPLDVTDQSSQVLRDADYSELRVMFSSGY